MIVLAIAAALAQDVPAVAPSAFQCRPPGMAWGADYAQRAETPCWLGDTLVVQLSAADGKAVRESIAATPTKHVGLFVEGRVMPGIIGRLGADDRAYFDLVRTDENRVLWSRYSPWLGTSHVDVAVGLDDASMFAGARGRLALQFTRPLWTALVAIPSTFLGLIITYFGFTTSMLRDGLTADRKPGTFSLARTQMAFWTVLVISSYLYLLAVCGTVDSLNASVLSVMGIGAGTALGAVAVEAQHDGNPAAPAEPSKNIVVDVLQGGTPNALHRIQLVAWTGIVGLVFLRSVIADLQFPTVDATLLALMGISGGTYLGFKIPEPPPREPGGKDAAPDDTASKNGDAKDPAGEAKDDDMTKEPSKDGGAAPVDSKAADPQ